MNEVIHQLEQNPAHLQSHWCLPQAEARLLYLLALIGKCPRLLEIGTSIGYSTLHLAQAAAENGGHLTTIDASAERQAEALKNLQAAGLASQVTLIHSDALKALDDLQKQEQTFSLMFVDARKSEYVAYLAAAEHLLEPGGLFLADNTRSHRHKMLDFIELVHHSPHWTVSDLETPSGLILARKHG